MLKTRLNVLHIISTNTTMNRSTLMIMPLHDTWVPVGLYEASARLSRSLRCSISSHCVWRMHKVCWNLMNTTFPRLQKRWDMTIRCISADCFTSILGFLRRSTGKWEQEDYKSLEIWLSITCNTIHSSESLRIKPYKTMYITAKPAKIFCGRNGISLRKWFGQHQADIFTKAHVKFVAVTASFF